ncbi:MAG: hypothetical protein ACI33N_03055 [Desulfovibrionaceae bacterium]
MAQEHEAFAKALQQVLEVVMFENWMRFYFISEKLDAPRGEDGEAPLFIAIPDQGMARIRELYPHLAKLAEDMNGKQVDFAESQRAICTFLVEELEGKSIPSEMSRLVLDSQRFNMELQLFNTWVQAHEDQLDEGFNEFGMWRKLFAEWRNSESVVAWVKQLREQPAAAAAAGKTVQ